MKPIIVTETIDAPRERVFEAITDIRAWPGRISAIDAVEVHTDQPVGVGTSFTETRTIFGKQASETMTVTEFDRPGGWLLEAQSNGMHYRTRTTLHDDHSDGQHRTRIEMSFAGEPMGTGARIMQAAMGWAMKGMLRKCLAADLAELKQHVEAEHAAEGQTRAAV